jgi:hypothetical protein
LAQLKDSSRSHSADVVRRVRTAAEHATSARAASIVSAHTASQIISIVTVLASDQLAAIVVALVSSPTR